MRDSATRGVRTLHDQCRHDVFSCLLATDFAELVPRGF
jgi:hypothetical protein